MYGTYEALSGFGYSLAAGLGNTEYSITAYPGICLHDQPCWGNARGQTFQWRQASDTSPRAAALYGERPEAWDFGKEGRRGADLVVVNLGTNDAHPANGVGSKDFREAYVGLVEDVHGVYPRAQIVVMSLWGGFSATGNTWAQVGAWEEEIYSVFRGFEERAREEGRVPFVHYFNSTGVLQHNDIGPLWHPTDVGHVKVCALGFFGLVDGFTSMLG